MRMPTHSFLRHSTSMMGRRLSRTCGSLLALGIGQSNFQCQWSGMRRWSAHRRLRSWWTWVTVGSVHNLMWLKDKPEMPGEDVGERWMADWNSDRVGHGERVEEAREARLMAELRGTAVHGVVKPYQRESMVPCRAGGRSSWQCCWNTGRASATV